MPSSALIICTSCSTVNQKKQTGVWLEEFAVPYEKFKDAGIDVTVVSIQGGDVPIDPASSKDASKHPKSVEALKGTRSIGSLQPGEIDSFDILYFPGGHGAMFDFPMLADVTKIVSAFAAKNKIIAAICHGPAALVNATRADNMPIVKGKHIVSFTDNEEREMKLEDEMPFMLESKLRELGANFDGGAPWTDKVCVDGHLITGQNPQSSASLADAVIKTLSPSQ